MDKKIQLSRSKEDFDFLMEAIRLGKENPDKTINKAVGAVLVKEGKIIGKGFRITYILNQNPYKDITYHGEHMAISQAGEDAAGSTLYVTLEPCAKRSIGPGWDAPEPCVEIIKKAGIKRVVIGIFDSDFGSEGSKFLLENDIEVAKMEEVDMEELKAMVEKPQILNDKAKVLQKKFYDSI